MSAGYSAVSLFFCLSGFVLAYNYLDVERDAITVDRGRFWLSRFARVYPAYLLALAVTAPIFISRMMEGADSILRVLGRAGVFGGMCLALLQSWSPKAALLWNFPGWSLATEAFFYAMFPLLATCLLPQWKTPRALLSAMVVLWVIAQIPPVLYLILDPENIGPAAYTGVFSGAFDGVWMRLVRFNPLCRLAEFVMGVFSGSCSCCGRCAGIGPGYRSLHSAWRWPVANIYRSRCFTMGCWLR